MGDFIYGKKAKSTHTFSSFFPFFCVLRGDSDDIKKYFKNFFYCSMSVNCDIMLHADDFKDEPVPLIRGL